MLVLKSLRFILSIEWSSIKISPESTSYKRPIKSRIVDFPEPVFPIIASVSP